MSDIKIGRKLAFLEFTAKYENRRLYVGDNLTVRQHYRIPVTVMTNGTCGFFRRYNQTIGFVKIFDEPLKRKVPSYMPGGKETIILEAVEIDGESFISMLENDDIELLFYLDIISK